MTDATTAPAPQAKPRRALADPRIEEIRKRRQERGTLSNDPRTKLSVPQEKLDPNWTYRWVNDREMRINQLQQQDWIMVDEETTTGPDDRNKGIGTRPERIVNDRTVSKPERAFLMRKPKEFYDEDQARRINRIRDQEAQMARGKVEGAEALSGNTAYIPAGGMSIKAGA